MKLRGAQIHELQLKYDSLMNENMATTNQLRESERMLALEKEKIFGVEKSLNQ